MLTARLGLRSTPTPQKHSRHSLCLLWAQPPRPRAQEVASCHRLAVGTPPLALAMFALEALTHLGLAGLVGLALPVDGLVLQAMALALAVCLPAIG